MTSEDPLRRRLTEAAGRIDDNPLPSRLTEITSRVEAHRRRTRIAAVSSAGALGVAALAVGIALSVQGPTTTPPAGPSSPAPAPTESGATEPPRQSDTATQEAPDPVTSPEDWSTPITPTCGAVLAPEDIGAGVVFQDPPEVLSPSESFPVTVTNPNDWTLQAELARYDAALPVLVDDEGTVVAVGDLEPMLNEGHSVLALPPGESVTMTGTLRWTPPCDGDEPAGDPYDHPVPEGEYLMYLLASTAGDDGANQVQGGPFPVRVEEGAAHEPPIADLQPGPALATCDTAWTAPDPGDLPGRIEPVDSPERVGPADPDAPEAGSPATVAVTFPGRVDGADLYASVRFVSADGTVVGPLAPAHDQSVGWYAGENATGELTVAVDPTDCAGGALPAGEYDLYYSLHSISAEGPDDTLALSEPVSVTVE